MQQKIIHIDADCFYAAVEMREQPQLRGRPMAVGGSSERRGVLTTCNYEARRFGLRSAMSSAQALKLCPQLLILPIRMPLYKEVSAQMRNIFADYTDLIEPLSLDEAYLDVSQSPAQGGSATNIAKEIRKRVERNCGITVSAGVAPNKFLAKVASDWNKPNGLTVIAPEQVEDFVRQLDVDKIHGVGKVTSQKLHKLGIYNCEQLRQVGKLQLSKHFGSFGQRLFELAHGRDDRKVINQRKRKSLSVERTFDQDICDRQMCLTKIPELMQELAKRLQHIDKQKIKNAFVKVKFNDFNSTTLELAGTTAKSEDYKKLLQQALLRSERPVRLLGLGVRFKDESQQQLRLFD
ncbi:DNA polymerase IV [Agaribacterium haliotis]|uniref:DNA polymerase IV n=1 Tax=Agaribacterium haliotis TaxID=2013869 RepID=UPI000BB57559|nr:DNA polymerase IV [Agaribacterium haliotis]